MNMQVTKEQADKVLVLVASALDLPEGGNKVLEVLNTAMADEWVRLEDYPNYEQNLGTGEVRNARTHRVLKPDAGGRVRLKGKSAQWDKFKVQGGAHG